MNNYFVNGKLSMAANNIPVPNAETVIYVNDRVGRADKNSPTKPPPKEFKKSFFPLNACNAQVVAWHDPKRTPNVKAGKAPTFATLKANGVRLIKSVGGGSVKP